MDATPAQLELARYLLAVETADQKQPYTAAEGAARVWQRLSLRLANIFTVAGCGSLAARALYLAQGDFPFLEGAGAERGLDGPPAAMEGAGDEQAVAAAAAILTNVIALLMTFIGEELALRSIRDVWPGASLRQPDDKPQEADR